jgi:hypothetical protein
MGIVGFIGTLAAIAVGMVLKPQKLNFYSVGLTVTVALYYAVYGYTKFYMTSDRYMEWYNSYFFGTDVNWSYWKENRFYLQMEALLLPLQWWI